MNIEVTNSDYYSFIPDDELSTSPPSGYSQSKTTVYNLDTSD